MPRVITGKYRGIILNAPKGDKTRPTTDKVKEALFSMIAGRIPEASVLDIFSGTGQIAIESISRGASKAIMIEKGAEQVKIIRSNLDKLHLEGEDISLMKLSYERALEVLGENKESFDIIFADPPYKMAKGALMRIADAIERHGLLKENGILIFEHDKSDSLPEDVTNLQSYRYCTYGITMITFFRVK